MLYYFNSNLILAYIVSFYYIKDSQREKVKGVVGGQNEVDIRNGQKTLVLEHLRVLHHYLHPVPKFCNTQNSWKLLWFIFFPYTNLLSLCANIIIPEILEKFWQY